MYPFPVLTLSVLPATISLVLLMTSSAKVLMGGEGKPCWEPCWGWVNGDDTGSSKVGNGVTGWPGTAGTALAGNGVTDIPAFEIIISIYVVNFVLHM